MEEPNQIPPISHLVGQEENSPKPFLGFRCTILAVLPPTPSSPSPALTMAIPEMPTGAYRSLGVVDQGARRLGSIRMCTSHHLDRRTSNSGILPGNLG